MRQISMRALWCGVSVVLYSSAAAAQSRPVWVCGGQSNAVALCNPTDGPLRTYADIVGSWRSGAPITDWQVGTPGWADLSSALSTPNISAFVWWQGETDVQYGVSYLPQLRELITRVRAAANNPRLPVFIVRVPRVLLVNGALFSIEPEQRLFVTADPDARIIETDLDGSWSWYRDSMHMTDEGYRSVAASIVTAIKRFLSCGC